MTVTTRRQRAALTKDTDNVAIIDTDKYKTSTAAVSEEVGGLTIHGGNKNPMTIPKKMGLNTKRNKSDYVVIALFYVFLSLVGSNFAYSNPEERDHFWWFFQQYSSYLGLDTGSEHNLRIYFMSWVVTSSALFGATTLLWKGMCAYQADIPTTHLKEQLKCVATNFLILPLYQTFWDYLAVSGYTKNTTGDLTPGLLVRDMALWMLVFELTWYTQHRAMHDNKYLWKYGHSYHHGWSKPEHMIGITNFAFDHVVETWVTMSSSFLPLIIFPCNFYVAKALSFGYMLLAVLVHWDAFPMKYHLNHHYLVVKNFGSHWPIFDMMFGTYQWDDFEPKDRAPSMYEH